MPYNFVADSFHMKKLCSRLSSSEVQFCRENDRLAFLNPPPLRDNVRCSSLAHGKHVMNFPLDLIGRVSLGVMAEALRANIG